MNLLESLNWRYAAKRMTGKTIPQHQIEEILEAIRLAPTAYGLQSFRVIATQNKELLSLIHQEACQQIVIEQCSHLLIFTTKKQLTDTDIQSYLHKLKHKRGENDQYIAHNREKLEALVANTAINNAAWTNSQTYIALGYATIAAANLRIDATPIEGFNRHAMDKLLQLNSESEGSTVLLALGYRNADEDRIAHKAKIRKEMEDLVEWR